MKQAEERKTSDFVVGFHRWPGWLPPESGARAMCEKCVEIDKTIERYRQIKRSIMDQLTVDRAKELIAELEARKAALHPE
jgi:hypothetical protein